MHARDYVFVLAIALAGVCISLLVSSQAQIPAGVQACTVVGSAPTYTANQVVGLTCNTAGQLRMSTTP